MIRMGEASNPDLLVHHLVKLAGFYPVSELRWHVTHACIIVPHNIYIIDVYGNGHVRKMYGGDQADIYTAACSA